MRRVLLDTHVYFWWATGSPRLSRTAYDAIRDRETQVLISVVAAWELATKSRIGRWLGADAVLADMEQALTSRGLEALSITLGHARLAGSLPGAHRDPFDRMLAAQARIEGLVLISADRAFEDFGVEVLW